MHAKVDKCREFSDQPVEKDKQQLWHSTLIKYGILKSNQFMTLKCDCLLNEKEGRCGDTSL